MNSKTTSILAVVCRIGKLIGALFTIIGMLVLIGTLTGLFKPEQSTSSYGYDDYYGYNYGWNSMEFPDGGDISSSREFLSDRSMISCASSSYEQMFVFDGFAEATPANLSGGAYSQMSALNSITGSLNFMCAGAFVMFFSSIGAFIFDLLSKKNMVGGFIDVCVGLMAFITNFMVTPSTSNTVSGGVCRVGICEFSVRRDISVDRVPVYCISVATVRWKRRRDIRLVRLGVPLGPL